jgi:hypothetical protein
VPTPYPNEFRTTSSWSSAKVSSSERKQHAASDPRVPPGPMVRIAEREDGLPSADANKALAGELGIREIRQRIKQLDRRAARAI